MKTDGKYSFKLSHCLTVVVLFSLLLACSNRPKLNDEGPFWVDDDQKPIPEPEWSEPSVVWTTIKRSSSDQTLQLLDLDRSIRKLIGQPEQSKNVNAHDEVPNSSWFSNRIGLPQTRPTPVEITSGVNLTSGPDTTGPWLVFRPKIGGMTAGFWIEDIRGDQYLIKFDPKGYPDLSTGSSIMAGRFFHAAGYNVPQETIVYWRKNMLSIKAGTKVKGADGKKWLFTQADLDGILETVHQLPDGRIRSLASLNLGNVKGPLKFRGRRNDDRNDWCPHEDRREIRALYVLASFVNHSDLKDHNSMDVYIGGDGDGYLRHYLMDFGSTFGSAGHSPMSPKAGYANVFDIRDIGQSLLTLGLTKWAWEDAKPWADSAVGYYEAELFDPGRWKPNVPDATLDKLTAQDGYWGAKIVTAFRDDDLRALTAAGQYSKPESGEYLFETMKARRDKIGRYWFEKINPLDYPRIRTDNESSFLTLVDLAVEYGLEPATNRYQYEIKQNGKQLVKKTETDQLKIPLSSTNQTINFEALLEIRVKSMRANGWTKEAIFRVSYNKNSQKFIVVSIEHLT